MTATCTTCTARVRRGRQFCDACLADWLMIAAEWHQFALDVDAVAPIPFVVTDRGRAHRCATPILIAQ